jgi:hypothetical protein
MGNHKNPDCSMFESAIQTKPVFREQNAAPKIINTCKESNDRQSDLWRKNADVIAGLAFCATMQLRTPLRVLVRHGEVHRHMNSPPRKSQMSCGKVFG